MWSLSLPRDFSIIAVLYRDVEPMLIASHSGLLRTISKHRIVVAHVYMREIYTLVVIFSSNSHFTSFWCPLFCLFRYSTLHPSPTGNLYIFMSKKEYGVQFKPIVQGDEEGVAAVLLESKNDTRKPPVLYPSRTLHKYPSHAGDPKVCMAS
mgnify:CR=1 FL=1